MVPQGSKLNSARKARIHVYALQGALVLGFPTTMVRFWSSKSVVDAYMEVCVLDGGGLRTNCPLACLALCLCLPR